MPKDFRNRLPGIIVSVLLLMPLFVFQFALPAQAETAVASFQVGLAAWAGSGHQYPMDVAPFIAAGRTYVPVRYLADGLGATTS